MSVPLLRAWLHNTFAASVRVVTKMRGLARFSAAGAFVAGGSAIVLYKAGRDVFLLNRTDYSSVADAELQKTVVDAVKHTHVGIEKVVGSSLDRQNLRLRKMTEVTNMLDNLSGNVDSGVIYVNALNLLAYCESSPSEGHRSSNLFLILPCLLVTRAGRVSVVRRKNTPPEEEAVGHYNRYMRELCMSYLIRHGHFFTWTEYALKQELMEIVIGGGFAYMISKWVPKFRNKV